MLKLTNIRVDNNYLARSQYHCTLELEGVLPGEVLSQIYNVRGIGSLYEINLPKNSDSKTLTLNSISNENQGKEPLFGGAWYLKNKLLYINKVIYSNPVTVVFWSDGTKTSSRCAEGDTYNAEFGLTMAILKKFIGNDSVQKTLADWLPADSKTKVVTLKDLRAKRYKAQKELKKETKQEVPNKEAKKELANKDSEKTKTSKLRKFSDSFRV